MLDLLHEGVSYFAGKTPQREAFRFLEESVSYAELDERSGQLAAVLIDGGVRPGDRVGIYLHKSLESAIAIFGIFKAGAAYVPLDPGAPVSRTSTLIEMCGIRILVTHEKKRKHVHEILSGRADLDCIIGVQGFDDSSIACITWEQVSDGKVANPVDIQSDSLAYVMYTSGSTGTPKGITHTHATGMASARMMADLFEVTSEDRLGNHAPLHFDISTFDYFVAPLRGASCVIVAEPYTKLPASLVRLVEQERLTTWYSVPFALQQMLQVGDLENRDFSSMRHVIFGGEPLHPAHLQQLMSAFSSATFTNYYGPAETNGCTYYHVPRPLDSELTNIPIGQMCNGATGLVIGDDDEPVSPGEQGELLVNAPTMMRGYWNAPELNSRCFFHRRNENGSDDCFYRTGDLVVWPAGEPMVFLGRKDRQVKLRGFRIELDEIEYALGTHEDVTEACAFLLRSGAAIEAAVILREYSKIDELELLSHASSCLPNYAVPSKVYVVEVFPRTGSQKIDRLAVRDSFEFSG